MSDQRGRRVYNLARHRGGPPPQAQERRAPPPPAPRWTRVANSEAMASVPGEHETYVAGVSNLVVIVSRTVHGVRMAVTHSWRYPTVDELMAARFQLVEDGPAFAIIMPKVADYLGGKNHTLHLHQVRVRDASAEDLAAMEAAAADEAGERDADGSAESEDAGG